MYCYQLMSASKSDQSTHSLQCLAWWKMQNFVISTQQLNLLISNLHSKDVKSCSSSNLVFPQTDLPAMFHCSYSSKPLFFTQVLWDLSRLVPLCGLQFQLQWQQCSQLVSWLVYSCSTASPSTDPRTSSPSHPPTNHSRQVHSMKRWLKLGRAEGPIGRHKDLR